MTRKSIYFTSDQHYGHKNSIEFDNRPFKDVEHMNRVLINNHNAVIPKNGICYHLGDFGMASFEESQKILSQLNGTNILILGNHDGNVNRMYRMGFDAVLYGAMMTIAGEMVTLSHAPLLGLKREDTSGFPKYANDNWHGESNPKMRKFTIPNFGQFHSHGHIHSSKDNHKSDVIWGRQYDVGVCGNNYTPVNISKIESWIAKTVQSEKNIDRGK